MRVCGYMTVQRRRRLPVQSFLIILTIVGVFSCAVKLPSTHMARLFHEPLPLSMKVASVC